MKNQKFDIEENAAKDLVHNFARAGLSMDMLKRTLKENGIRFSLTIEMARNISKSTPYSASQIYNAFQS